MTDKRENKTILRMRSQTKLQCHWDQTDSKQVSLATYANRLVPTNS
jgi:hypothetical protein